MALLLSQTDSGNGAAVSYIRIDNINLPNLTSGGVLRVGYYVDGATAKSKSAVSTTEITLTDAESATLRTQGLALLYGILKARSEFAGAIDV